jgi:hypothetical protein
MRSNVYMHLTTKPGTPLCQDRHERGQITHTSWRELTQELCKLNPNRGLLCVWQGDALEITERTYRQIDPAASISAKFTCGAALDTRVAASSEFSDLQRVCTIVSEAISGKDPEAMVHACERTFELIPGKPHAAREQGHGRLTLTFKMSDGRDVELRVFPPGGCCGEPRVTFAMYIDDDKGRESFLCTTIQQMVCAMAGLIDINDRLDKALEKAWNIAPTKEGYTKFYFNRQA